ncbi:hypothetical protein QMN58_26795, partial [Escherichia coli]|nr:hypothetical protein [Escherichia coli]
AHRWAAQAIAEGRFNSQIVPIVKQTKKGEVRFDTDEHVKPGTTMETLGRMKPAFKKDGTVTAGNASGINDGAAFFPMRQWPPLPRCWMPWTRRPTGRWGSLSRRQLRYHRLACESEISSSNPPVLFGAWRVFP